MSRIVLATINSRYHHASLGLRCIMANLGPLADEASLHEFILTQRPVDIVEQILLEKPAVVGLGVYIWNARPSLDLVVLLKRLRPEIVVVVGGPEVSHGQEQQTICSLADYVVAGEGELGFRGLCEDLLAGRTVQQKIVEGEVPDLKRLAFPYDLYDEEDIRNRVVYVESSRGCPYGCEFCLSALDRRVRNFPRAAFLHELEGLLKRGVKRFKFVDRSINVDPQAVCEILRFFLPWREAGLFLHFEMVPHILPAPLCEMLELFPTGSIQIEVGVQTLNEEVALRIGRRHDPAALKTMLPLLREHTGVHIHTDLIVGLPGESLESFAGGFDHLLSLAPQEIQVGVLKWLRGAPIDRQTATWRMEYDPEAPYELLQNSTIDFATMQRLKRFSRYWDLVANSGNFRECLSLLLTKRSAFFSFLTFSDWLFAQCGRTSHISLDNLAHWIFDYLIENERVLPDRAGAAIAADYTSTPRRPPPWLKPFVDESTAVVATSQTLPNRQARHAATTRRE
ncbi:MAG: hypothetical protein A2289_25640 [Deltaproteobacteria bacterium RIFOXYA12_FULL_58_15]|nr:MAG: hypothetical protein A2289_25640 [Deltaproteobacteria bacterium RIFOXYA12_FULL_58_15]